jgi:glycosyltransferase involved in cell wall biosynthesis
MGSTSSHPTSNGRRSSGRMTEVVVDGLIYESQAYGGISRLWSEILPRMCRLDDSLHVVLVTCGRIRRPLPVHTNVKHRAIWRIDDLFRRPSLRELLFRLARPADRRGIWHSTYYTTSSLWRGPRVVTVPDMIHELFPPSSRLSLHEDFMRQKRRCVQEADAVICISEATRSDLLAVYGVPAERTRVIPLGTSEEFRVLPDAPSSDKSPGGRPYLLYVGERLHYKGFGTLMRAYARWAGHDRANLLAVGPNWSKQESEELERLKLRGRVVSLGRMDDHALCLLYNRALALVFPSLYEGFGLPLLEAMACGCPIVAARIPSTMEVARDHPFYFEPENGESLVAALDRALDEGKQTQRMTLGFEQAKRFSWDNTASQTLITYRALL